jgi:hypothetical protein
LVSDPTIFRIDDITIIPINVPKIILYEATPVAKSIIAAIPMAIMEVSPTDPGMLPMNASNHEKLSL